ncbi:MAG TPA: sulfate adenylyltransferase subunit CysN [Bryobacteraceae bacterium]|nr:sulfate adenylyltransferase subunit CysN [Bryobacteraceae bacterium]
MASSAAGASSIEQFLQQEYEKQLLRFTTAGSVDDGKSTLIGRLLYDSKGVYEDQIASVRQASVNRSAGPIDFSLLTDGLRAEREQGITIDVAYRYFATPKRKFIIADTPGHEQYTRNMATGASTAQLAIGLVDARKGVLPQSRRHAYIASLLGIPYVVVAINKMDLVDFRQEVFDKIRAEFLEFAAGLQIPNLYFIPLSALDGDNVVSSSPRTTWYNGANLLEYLESVPIDGLEISDEVRFPVQYVVRPTLDFRGYAGQVASGVIRPGDRLMVLPSGRTSKVSRIVTFDGDLTEAYPPLSVTICLEDEIDISRGDMLVSAVRMPHASRRFEATLVWMHPDALELNRPYLIKHNTQQVKANVTAVLHKIDINTQALLPAESLDLNEIGSVQIETHKPIFFDSYRKNRATGSLIFIDPITNLTVAAGMISERAQEQDRARRNALQGVEFEKSRLTPAERWQRNRHRPAAIWLTARLDVAYRLERELFDRGCNVHVLADEADSHLLPELARLCCAAGLITICSTAYTEPEARAVIGPEWFVEIDPQTLPSKDEEAVTQITMQLEELGVILPDERGTSGDGI